MLGEDLSDMRMQCNLKQFLLCAFCPCRKVFDCTCGSQTCEETCPQIISLKRWQFLSVTLILTADSRACFCFWQQLNLTSASFFSHLKRKTLTLIAVWLQSLGTPYVPDSKFICDCHFCGRHFGPSFTSDTGSECESCPFFLQTPGPPFIPDEAGKGVNARIIFVQHGATLSSEDNLLMGTRDEAPSTLGDMQINKAAELLMDLKVGFTHMLRHYSALSYSACCASCACVSLCVCMYPVR